MCRSKVEKEEVFITQNASGGSNSATIQEYHLSNISIVLIVMCTMIGIAGLYAVYRLYRNCHHTWIRNEFLTQQLMRSFRRPEGRVVYEGHQRQLMQSCEHRQQPCRQEPVIKVPDQC